MTKEKIRSLLTELTGHKHVGITTRGNAAIKTALSILAEGLNVLIPEEGGWLSYQTLPQELGLKEVEVRCDDAKINMDDLKEKLSKYKPAAFLYHNPGGYFAEEDTDKIYKTCKQNGCLVILDVSGSLGTELCRGKDADVMVGSFGRWKLADAGKGGFISSDDEKLWKKIEKNLKELDDEKILAVILQKLKDIPERKKRLQDVRKKVITDLREYDVVYPNDFGLVVIIKYSMDEEKENLINYCKNNNLEWTECPRYIRLNKKAISIEIKRL